MSYCILRCIVWWFHSPAGGICVSRNREMMSFSRLSRLSATFRPKRLFTQVVPPPPSVNPAVAPKPRFGKVQRLIRVARVIFVSVAIYQVGYQNGMVHFAQDPQAVEEELIKFSLGIDANDKIETHVHSELSSTHRRVRRIGNRIIEAAQQHSKKQLQAATAACTALAVDKDARARWEQAEQERQLWEQACRRLKGNWSFIVCKNRQVNAFVSGFCPRKVFVFDGLLSQLELTDDELAMILGHEMSHVVLGHIEEQTPVTAIILATQLILMSLIDPVGLGSFIFDIVVTRFGKYIQAGYSRQHEFEADELGLTLASLACFDMKAGHSLHQKLGAATHHHETSWEDSHPSSLDRLRKLVSLTDAREKEPNYTEFKKECAAMRNSWQRAVFGVGK